MKPIVIERNKVRFVVLIICSLLFTVACALILISNSRGYFNYGLLAQIFLFIGMFFFGFCTIAMVKMIAQTKPLLVINDEGIEDNSSAISCGLIDWEDIANVSIVNVMGNKFIELTINNEDKYLSRLSASQKVAALANKHTGFSSVNLNVNGASKSPEQLLNIINDELNRRRNEQKVD